MRQHPALARIGPAVLLFCLITPRPVAAQGPDPKTAFINALASFSLNLRGTFGDEGARLDGNIAAMRAALADWDAGIASFAQSLAAQRAGAPPALAARMHLAVGALYLDRGRVADAVREFQAAAAADPSRADAHAFLALAHERANNAAGTNAALERAATLDAQNPAAWYRLGHRLIGSGATRARGEAALQRAIDLIEARVSSGAAGAAPFVAVYLAPETPAIDPFFPPALYARGFALLDAGDFDGVIRSFTDAIKKDSLAAPAGAETGAMRRAAAALRDGALQTAIQQLGVAVTLEPERSEPHRLLAHAYRLDQQYERALTALATAARLNGADERVRLQTAQTLTEQGAHAEAIRTLTDTVRAIPASGRAVYELGLALQRDGQYAKAVEQFNAALRFKPLLGLNSVYQTIGALHRSQQDFERAAAAFENRVALVPNDAAAHQELGDMYLRLERHQEALAEFSVAVLLDPKHVTAHAAAAQVHLRDGRFEAAARASRRVLALDDGHREARYTLATSLIRLGQEGDGRKELAVFQRHQVEDAVTRARVFELEGYKREATVNAAAGDHAKAIALLRKVLDAEPKLAASHLDLGLALIEAKQFEEGVDHLRQAAALGAHYDVHRRLADALASLGQASESARERAIHDTLKQEELRREAAK